MGLISELRRRNVLRMAVLYVVAAWLIMQVAGVLIDLGSVPAWIGPITLPLLAIGLPIALIFSWFYEITPEGISLEKDVDVAESITHVTGRRLDFIVISLLSAGLILFAYDKWWIGPPPEKSIAVLAFENMSGDPEQEYFSDGISEELLNVLAEIPGLTVISRPSAFSFKGKDIAIPAVAEQLNVAHVLAGSVRRDGNRVRITAQLIEASSDSHLWSQSYDRELNDILAIQEEIASAITEALKVRLLPALGGSKRPTVIKTASMNAYDAYLRGRELIRVRGRENLEEAIRHLERSLRLDDSFAPAHAQLAIANLIMVQATGGHVNAVTQEEGSRAAIPHLDRAQELEPDLAEAHGGRALLALFTGDPESTIEHARKALASNPNYSDAMNWLQSAFLDLGRYEESNAALKQMLVTDPLTIVGRINYVERLNQTGQMAKAHELADELLEQDPGWGYYAHADTSLTYEGEIAEALYWALKLAGELDRGTSLLKVVFNFVGEYDECRRVIEVPNWWVDGYVDGSWEEAIRATQAKMDADPDNADVIEQATDVLYAAGRIGEALPLLERLLDLVPEARSGSIRLALARRKAGDEEGAQAVIQIVKQDHAARLAAGENNWSQDLTEAELAAFEGDPDRAFAMLESAIQRGLRFRWHFEDPIFEHLRDEPRFIALRAELDAILAVEHDKVLQLICFNNPTPDNWQPLPETCEGVVERRP